jgi:malate/lactate dehydrogenase
VRCIILRENVMIFGAGEVGRFAAYYLALNPTISKIAIVDKDYSKAYSVAANAKFSASYFSISKDVAAFQLDLSDIERVVEKIAEIEPSAILHASTTIPSSFYNPLIQRRMKEIGFRKYCPAHNLAKDLFPLYKLMLAIREAGLDVKVVNVSSPDNAHPVLGKIGLCPTIGAGNVDIISSCIRKMISDKITTPLQKISVTLIAHYAIYYCMLPPEKIPFWYRDKAIKNLPFYMRVKVDGNDWTPKFNAEDLIRTANDVAFSAQGYHTQMAAASAVRQILCIVENRMEVLHGNGVNGIPGCVPAKLGGKGAEIVLPEDLTLDEAVKINEVGMKWSGIEKVEKDGTVIFTEEAVELLENALGIHRKKMEISEIEEMGKELLFAYKSLSEKYSNRTTDCSPL